MIGSSMPRLRAAFFFVLALSVLLATPARAQSVSATASGTYTWNASTGVINWTWTSSTFTCEGPSTGVDFVNGVTVTATAMTWPNDGMTWTRPGGTAGDIVGTWNFADSLSGNSFSLVFNANGTASVAGNIVSCTQQNQNPRADAQHWSDGYSVQFKYDESPKTATSVTVTGPGLSGPAALTYSPLWRAWVSWTRPSVAAFFGPAYPSGLPYTYTFSITDAAGTRTATSAVSCFQVPLVTNLSPIGPITGTPTFRWTGIADPGAIYGVELNDSNNVQVWHNRNVLGTSATYDGPALTPGMTYSYNVIVVSTAACSSGQSFAQGSITYAGTTPSPSPAPVTPVATITPTTPLPPPPVTQTVFAAPTGTLPAAAVAVTPSGTYGSASLIVRLDLSKIFPAGTLAGLGQFAAGYNIYVAALVPAGALGLPSATWFALAQTGNSQTRNWTPLGSPIAAYMTGLAQNATNAVEIAILQGLDMTGLVGTEFYIGYGIDDREMLQSGRYRGVYKAQ